MSEYISDTRPSLLEGLERGGAAFGIRGFIMVPELVPFCLDYCIISPITSFLFSNLFSLTFPWPSFWYQLRLGSQIVVSFFLFFKISFYFLVATLVSFKPFYHFPYFFKKFGRISSSSFLVLFRCTNFKPFFHFYVLKNPVDGFELQTYIAAVRVVNQLTIIILKNCKTDCVYLFQW